MPWALLTKQNEDFFLFDEDEDYDIMIIMIITITMTKTIICTEANLY